MAWAFDLFFFVGFSGPRAWIRQSSRFFYALKFGFYHFPNNGGLPKSEAMNLFLFLLFFSAAFFRIRSTAFFSRMSDGNAHNIYASNREEIGCTLVTSTRQTEKKSSR